MHPVRALACGALLCVAWAVGLAAGPGSSIGLGSSPLLLAAPSTTHARPLQDAIVAGLEALLEFPEAELLTDPFLRRQSKGLTRAAEAFAADSDGLGGDIDIVLKALKKLAKRLDPATLFEDVTTSPPVEATLANLSSAVQQEIDDTQADIDALRDSSRKVKAELHLAKARTKLGKAQETFRFEVQRAKLLKQAFAKVEKARVLVGKARAKDPTHPCVLAGGKPGEFEFVRVRFDAGDEVEEGPYVMDGTLATLSLGGLTVSGAMENIWTEGSAFTPVRFLFLLRDVESADLPAIYSVDGPAGSDTGKSVAWRQTGPQFPFLDRNFATGTVTLTLLDRDNRLAAGSFDFVVDDEFGIPLHLRGTFDFDCFVDVDAGEE